MQKLVEGALTVMQEPPTQSEVVNTTEWAKFLEFKIEGDSRTEAQLTRMVEMTARFMKAIKAQRSPRWLSFLGTSGAGKTHLARKVWLWFKGSSFFNAEVNPSTKEIYYPGSWVFWPNLASDLLSNSGYGQLEDLKNEKFVVLDEIGADRDPSGHVRDCLARLLSARVGKWTVLTSNKTLGDIERDIDARISSRIIRDENLLVDVDVPDYALRKAP
jgi:DNA replication protein DnaC